MRLAIAEAMRARELGEVPIGAVVMRGGALAAAAHNETVARRDPTAHAELLVIQRALAAAASDRLTDATLYATVEPCAQCAGAIVLAKVGRVVFGAWDEKAGMSGSIHDLLRHSRLNHRVDVTGGALAEDCAAMLTSFFQALRAD
jgi:tRNA(adenine34) deaminase